MVFRVKLFFLMQLGAVYVCTNIWIFNGLYLLFSLARFSENLDRARIDGRMIDARLYY